MGKVLEGVAAGVAIGAAVVFPNPYTIGLAVSVSSSFLRDMLQRPPRLTSPGFSNTQQSQDQQSGLPVPYGVTGVVPADPTQLLPGQYPTGQPALGVTVVRREVTGTSKAPHRYLWLVCGVSHGAVRSVDTVYISGAPALVRTTVGGVERLVSMRSTVVLPGSPNDYSQNVLAFAAMGTDGQRGVVDYSRTPINVSNSVQDSPSTWRKLTIGTHPFIIGDAVWCQGVAGLGDSYYIVTAKDSTHIWVFEPDGAGGASRGGGTVSWKIPTPPGAAFYTVEDGGQHAMGKGTVFLVIRLTQDATHFADSTIPNITVGLSGVCSYDPRSGRTLTIATVDDGGAGGMSLSHTARVTFTGAHGLSEGDIIKVSGTGMIADGVQRADRILSSTQIQIFCTDVLQIDVAIPTVHTGTAVTLSPTSNPAIAIRDYLTNGRYGVGCTAAEINDTSFIAAANYCDQLVYAPQVNTSLFGNSRNIQSTAPAGAGHTTVVIDDGSDYSNGDVIQIHDAVVVGLEGLATITAGGGTTSLTVDVDSGGLSGGVGGVVQLQVQQARFAFSGVADTNQSLKSNLQTMMACCRAALVQQSGQYTLSIRQPTSIVDTLTQDDFVGNWAISLPGQDISLNFISGQFVDPFHGYQRTTATWPSSPQDNLFLEDDQGQLNTRELDLSFIADLARAWQVLMVYRRESRVALSITATVQRRAIKFVVGDLIGVTHDTPGWTNQPFWVGPMELREDGLVNITLEGYDATAYDLEATDDLPFSNHLAVTGALTVDPPTAVIATGYVNRRTITVSWVLSDTIGIVHYEAQYQEVSTSTPDIWQGGFTVDASATTGDLTDLDATALYNIRLRAIHSSGAHSVWVELSAQSVEGDSTFSGFPLVMRVRRDIADEATVMLNVYMADPHVLAHMPYILSAKGDGVGGVIAVRTLTQTDQLEYPYDGVTSDIDSTAFVQFKVDRPDVGQPPGIVSVRAHRQDGGRVDATQAITIDARGSYGPPVPVISFEQEATARDGNSEGQVHIKLGFEHNTLSFYIYATESEAAGGAAPDLTANSLAGIVTRHEGIIEDDENWETEFDISTTPLWYRQIVIIPEGFNGQRGDKVSVEVQAVDVGAPPSAPPSHLVVTMSTVASLPRATVDFEIGDDTAEHRVFRNGIVIDRLPAGASNFVLVDDGLTPGINYSYKVQAIKDGQTSEFAGADPGSSDVPMLGDPSWEAGFPTSGAFRGSFPYMNIGVVNPDPAAQTDIYHSFNNSLGPYILIDSIPPGQSNKTLFGNDYSGFFSWAGGLGCFKLKASRAGFTPSNFSLIATAIWGSDE